MLLIKCESCCRFLHEKSHQTLIRVVDFFGEKMKKDNEEYLGSERTCRRLLSDFFPRKMNNLLSELQKKEEEISVYKERLKEIESAFYYNLEIISERDFELSVLEKELNLENEHLEKVLREKEELENSLHAIDRKNIRKIHHLETILSHREQEIKALQEENMRSINTLKKMSTNVREQEWKKILQLSMKYESERKKLTEGYREEMEEKEKYYLLEIDCLTGKLEEVRREKSRLKKVEEENQSLRNHLVNMEKLFRERETFYLEQLNGKTRYPSREVQCQTNVVEVNDKQSQAQAVKWDAQTQTLQPTETDDFYKKKLIFLQEQNEVLKCVIKELKKNNNFAEVMEILGSEETPCSECKSARQEIRAISERFDKEINNLKDMLTNEQTQRAEEETVLISLEASMSSLREKMLLGLSRNPDNPTEFGESHHENPVTRSNVQPTSLEDKISEKIDCLILEAQEERLKVAEKLEDLKRECLEKLEKMQFKPPDEKVEARGENFLQQIRMEITKLENKIESDMRNMIRYNSEITTNKCDKNLQTGTELLKRLEKPFPQNLALADLNFRETYGEREIPVYLSALNRRNYVFSDVPAKPSNVTAKMNNEMSGNGYNEFRLFGKLAKDFAMGG